MQQKIGYVALVVRDYDEAIAFYTQSLGFGLIEDTDLGSGKRYRGCPMSSMVRFSDPLEYMTLVPPFCSASTEAASCGLPG